MVRAQAPSRNLTTTELARFYAKVDVQSGCWLWRRLGANGYGYFYCRGKSLLAHRLSYEMRYGPIPEGLTLDHLCRTPACIRPSHLEPVTMGENSLRGIGWCAERARATHCIHGHEFTPENTYVFPNGHRKCRTCRKLDARVRWNRERDRLNRERRERYREQKQSS